MKILMVCLGNICRSPLAEGILKSKVEKQKLNWTIDSAGTGAWHIGNPPDSRSQLVANQHQLDITNQRARQFSKNDFDDFDLILAMDQSNYQDLTRLAENDLHREKLRRILSFTENSHNDVPDPYYNDNGFEHVYQLLDKACDDLIHSFIPFQKNQ